ncbi:flavin-containing monooxygenase [Pseudovibrio sp. SPO723]|uniref:flavin-containing monooxygenase n=1 Tax=Nesiotobacter zosterae TaxID=392721 RepID=UPI0029C2F969|nr:NAD(P)-binding domain-containing protein [Pseudovibrio sp. SPO723]MDX5593428.1 NAD(P)-binding domain-containing protein [Pseudovibrio sp. SPO723]
MGRRVAVIGAGPSGLAAMKNFKDFGFNVVGFERGRGVGGNWRFDDEAGHSSVFEHTHIISSKTLSQYEDYPFPDWVADYPSHQVLRNYFEGYAATFGLMPLIRFQTEIEQLEPDRGGGWRLRWMDHGKAAHGEDSFDAVCVCNGHHHTPRYPDYPGEFNGEFLHSHEFKRAERFRGKRILVIGGGNSACDVAVETARVSARTVISWRRGYHLFPKFLFGQPIDVLMKRFVHGPFWLQKKTLAYLLWLVQGSNRKIGLQDPDHEILATHPTVNSDLYSAIRHGDVQPKGDIDRFHGATVHFKDGSQEDFDTIIACTGYKIQHAFIDPSLFDFSKGTPRLYMKMIPEDAPGLYFMGLFQPLGCIWPGAELQSKLAARHFAGLWSPKAPLSDLIDQEIANPDVKQLKSARHTITVHDGNFRKRLKKELARSTPASAHKPDQDAA